MEKYFDKQSILMIGEHYCEEKEPNSEIIESIARRARKYKGAVIIITSVLNAEPFLVQSVNKSND